MVTAAAAASVAETAPGRLTVAFGTGHTARRALGQRPARITDLVREARQVRSLLAGEVVDIDGQPGQMRQQPVSGPAGQSASLCGWPPPVRAPQRRRASSRCPAYS
jgi:5,10-methylenetetrahydromethanopterin reductase